MQHALLRVLAYLWALPTTAVGLSFAACALVSRGRVQWVDGVLEVHGGFVTWFLAKFVPMVSPLSNGASAMTLGHVVIGQDELALDLSRRHERVHVRQCERWGPLFLPAYGCASLWCLLRGQNPYWDNPFEAEAYRKA